MITPQPGPDGRSAGSLTWGGIFNSYYWIDLRQQVAGVIMMQIMPFADARGLGLYRAFEHTLYEALAAA
jgi:methyl acetate hydrolase